MKLARMARPTRSVPWRLSLVLLALSLAGSAAQAGEAEPATATLPCPDLMTERECAAHRDTLAALGPGPEREAYLSTHAQLMLERERACACTRGPERDARPARRPLDRQALLRW